MQRGQVHLLIFVLGLFALAALAWLVAWLTGFPEWSVILVFCSTALFLILLLLFVLFEAIEYVDRLMFGFVSAVDDRNCRTSLRFSKEKLDDAERRSLDGAMKSVAGSGRFHPQLPVAFLLPAIALFALMMYVISVTPHPYNWVLVPIAILAPTVAGVRVTNRITLRWEAQALAIIGRCGACGYPLRGLPPEADGCRVCPECGAAWRMR